MTTIFIDLDNQVVVADKRRTSSAWVRYQGEILKDQGVGYDDTPSKISYIDDNTYMTGSGCSSEIANQILSYQRDKTLVTPKDDDTTITVVSKLSVGLQVDMYRVRYTKGFLGMLKKKYWERQTYKGNTKYITFGSGSQYAEGAYHAGCSAEEAVKIAGRIDPYTSEQVDVVGLSNE